jgi:hypothetical protein
MFIVKAFVNVCLVSYFSEKRIKELKGGDANVIMFK